MLAPPEGARMEYCDHCGVQVIFGELHGEGLCVEEPTTENEAGVAVRAILESDPSPLEQESTVEWTDWQTLLAEGVPEIEYLSEPYIPKGYRIWAWGATGTAKSMWAMGQACEMSRRGLHVAYFSEENAIATELWRLGKLRPDPEHFHFAHRSGLDLARGEHVEAMLRATEGHAAVFFDSWTDLWSGDEGDNRAVQQFDATVLKRLQAQGVTPIVLHHTGHGQLGQVRRGATAGRGASALGQKADVTLEFKGEGIERTFRIVWGKERIPAPPQPDRIYEIRDTDEGTIEFVEVAGAEERRVEELAAAMVEAILSTDASLTTKDLRASVPGGNTAKSEALQIVEADPRVEVWDGPRGARMWGASGVVQRPLEAQ